MLGAVAVETRVRFLLKPYRTYIIIGFVQLASWQTTFFRLLQYQYGHSMVTNRGVKKKNLCELHACSDKIRVSLLIVIHCLAKSLI